MKCVLALSVSAGLLLTMAAAATTCTEVSADFAVYAKEPPVLDGKLDESVCPTSAGHSRFYGYVKKREELSPLKSEMRLLWNESGLYMGFTHFDPHAERIVRRVKNRDDGNIWTDDSSEIYLDPNGQAIGYTKFTVTAGGTVADMRRMDPNVVLEGWDGTGWRVKTAVEKDRWTLEMFVPWEDAGGVCPRPGQRPWRFCVTRFCWSDPFDGEEFFTAAFRCVGSVSTPGGGYFNTQAFGYLSFLAEGEKPDVARLTKTLSEQVRPPWCCPVGDLVAYDAGEGAKTDTVEALVAEKASELKEKRAAHPDAPAKFAVPSVEKPMIGDWLSLSRLCDEFDDWAAREALKKEMN